MVCLEMTIYQTQEASDLPTAGMSHITWTDDAVILQEEIIQYYMHNTGDLWWGICL